MPEISSPLSPAYNPFIDINLNAHIIAERTAKINQNPPRIRPRHATKGRFIRKNLLLCIKMDIIGRAVGFMVDY
jgi:hypothetical protein